MNIFRRLLLPAILCVGAAVVLQGCQTLREIAALRSVDFALDRVMDAELAGVELERIRSYRDLRTTDVARIGAAVASGELPLSFELIVAARNPEENRVQARMVRMAWTMLIEDRETISGVVDETFTLPPGELRNIPVAVRLDLVEFFDANLRDLVELAVSATGQGGEPTTIKLEAVPTIDTPLGAIEYPEPITIVHRQLGGAAAGT
jgi:hypothetical protein